MSCHLADYLLSAIKSVKQKLSYNMKEHKKEKHSITETPVEEVKESVPVENPLQKELEELKDKYDSLNDKYIRLAAEFDNYRRRTAKEKLDLVLTAAEDTVKGILTVLDDIERAIEVLKAAEGDHKPAIEGTELIYAKLYNYLESKGLKRMEPLGSELDTDYHEAVAQYPAPDKKSRNKIINVVQNGYLLKGKVIRYAKVVVGI